MRPDDAENPRKRGGGGFAIVLNESIDGAPLRDEQMNRAGRFHGRPRQIRSTQSQGCGVVELRFFGGLSVRETAAMLKTSEQTVPRDCRLARTWLAREMELAGGAGN